MSIPNFVAGYPLDGSSLGSSKAQIRDNIDGTFQTLGVDHFDNNGDHGGASGDAGTHYQVQMKVIAGSSPPTGLLANYGTLYTQTVGAGVQLFYTRINSGVGIQLTGPGVPVLAAKGRTFLPGGILLQWGTVTSTNQTGNETFSTPFPNAVFSITLTSIANASTNHANGLYIEGSPALGNFDWIQADRANPAQTGFYWMAIGN